MAGRPHGSVTCEVIGERMRGACRMGAQVRVTVRVQSAQGDELRTVETLRCWEHYLELEERARSSSTLEIISAERYKKSAPDKR